MEGCPDCEEHRLSQRETFYFHIERNLGDETIFGHIRLHGLCFRCSIRYIIDSYNVNFENIMLCNLWNECPFRNWDINNDNVISYNDHYLFPDIHDLINGRRALMMPEYTDNLNEWFPILGLEVN